MRPLRAREALAGGLASLLRRPGLVAVGLALTAATWALMGAVGSAALAAARAGLRAGDAGRVGRALLSAAGGLSLFGLVSLAALALALVAATAAPSLDARRVIGRAARLVPALVTLRVLELCVLLVLAGGGFVTITGITEDLDGGTAALAGAVVATPLAAVALLAFTAGRVATVLVARGAVPAAAFVRGLDVALRDWRGLLRLGAAWLLVAAPLELVALLLGGPVGRAAGLLAALWGYAALDLRVGRDPRLVGG